MKTIHKSVFLATLLLSVLGFATDHAYAGAFLSFTKFANGVDANTAEEAPLIAPGDLVTWTYRVENTGANVDEGFASGDISILDDNGTPDASDDFNPAFSSFSAGDMDGILEPGEVWLYEASDTAIAGGALNTATLTAISSMSRTTIELTDIAIYVDPTALEVPEPATLALFAIALGGLGFMTRRRVA